MHKHPLLEHWLIRFAFFGFLSFSVAAYGDINRQTDGKEQCRDGKEKQRKYFFLDFISEGNKQDGQRKNKEQKHADRVWQLGVKNLGSCAQEQAGEKEQKGRADRQQLGFCQKRELPRRVKGETGYRK